MGEWLSVALENSFEVICPNAGCFETPIQKSCCVGALVLNCLGKTLTQNISIFASECSLPLTT